MRRRSKVISTLAVASQVAGALVLVALETGQCAVQATSTGPYTLDCGNNTDGNANGALDYESSDNLTITFEGPGRATIEIAPECTTDRVIHHRGTGALTLERVRITGGDLTDVNSFSAHGGGILPDGVGGTLILNDVSAEGHRSSAGGLTPKGPQGGRGGGIAADATTTVNISGGSVGGPKRGDGNSAGSAGSPLSGSSAAHAGSDGGIYAAGVLTIDGATIANNSAGDSNYPTGTPIANGATIKLSAQGTICIFTNQPIDLIVDVTGYTPNIP
jgi:hypothetical protein